MNKIVLAVLLVALLIITVVIIVLVLRARSASQTTPQNIAQPVAPTLLPGCVKSTTVPSYQFCAGLDSDGGDIGQSANLANNITGLANACDANSTCRGFNTNGWLKNTIADQPKWVKWTTDPAKGLYVKAAERFTPRVQGTSTGLANLNPFA